MARWLGDEVRGWPDKRLVITAVDAESGEPADFDAGSGVDLLDAVCASTAGPGVRPPATIGGHRYIDGAMLLAHHRQPRRRLRPRRGHRADHAGRGDHARGGAADRGAGRRPRSGMTRRPVF
ncbi:patatin-like phospholipase family protein [Nonomuraea angiospora]|uniref:patatin-like phospholipase family protein n=1 Tax=Nonomuraea angiospora TaxID=46172 RepID=UPI0033243C6F